MPPHISVPITAPALFRIVRGGKRSIIFGSYHSAPASTLPPQVLEVINACGSMVTEKTNKDVVRFFSVIKRKPGSEGFAHQLRSKEIKEFLEQAFTLGLHSIVPSKPKWLPKLEEVELWAAYFFVDLGIQQLRLKKQSNQRAKVKSLLSMDAEFIRRWTKKSIVYGLEGWMNRVPYYQVKAEKSDDLIKLYNAFHDRNEQDKVGPEEKRLQELGGFWECYRTAAGLFDGPLARIVSEDEDRNQRNKNWMPFIIKLHQNLECPLFCVGMSHLLGEEGLLSLLQQANFKIDRLGPNGFQEYVYPFNENYIRNNSFLARPTPFGWMRTIAYQRENEAWKKHHKQHPGKSTFAVVPYVEKEKKSAFSN